MAMGALQAKIGDYLRMRTSSSLGTPSIVSVHDYRPFAFEDGGWLAPMTLELVDRLSIMVAIRRFLGMGAADSRSLRSETYARMKDFVRRFTYVPFRRFLGKLILKLKSKLITTCTVCAGFTPKAVCAGCSL
jgi:hypothetical protein